MMEDEFEAMKPASAPKELERWNLEDLQAYKSRLLEEVARIDGVIEDKSSVHSEAEDLFKS
jgi:hypothetical protein